MNDHGKRTAEYAFYQKLIQKVTTEGKLLLVNHLLQRAYNQSPNSIALVHGDKNITYEMLYWYVCRFVPVLKQRGLCAGDRVIIFFENSPEFYIAYFATWHCGAVVVPMNTFLQRAEINHILSDSQPKIIISHSSKKYLFDEQEGCLLTELDMEHLIGKEADESIIDCDEDSLIALLYTSGTTGTPKGVMLCSKNIMMNILQGITTLQLSAHERICGVLPFFHSFAQLTCLWGAIFLCCTVIIVPRIERRYIYEGLVHKPTFMFGVPALYGLLCLMKRAPLDSIKWFISGGDALPDKIRAGFGLLYRRMICSGYGLTEASPLVSVDFDDILVLANNVGRPCVDIECEIRTENGTVLQQGSIGQLWLRGPNVMMGYYRAPEQTAMVIQNGWLATGDFAYIDKSGKIVITGRLKDLIIHKGIKVYPQEVENVIMSHPQVIAVGVIGIKDEICGEYPVAYLQVKSMYDGIDEEIKRICNDSLAPYKIPRQFFCSIQALPLTATGKVNKKILKEKISQE